MSDEEIQRIRREALQKYGSDPFRKYHIQKSLCKNRDGVEMRMSFLEWWAIWEPHYKDRGRGAGKLVMCRDKDEGHYEVGNVRIDYGSENVKEHFRLKLKEDLEEEWGDNQEAVDWLEDRIAQARRGL